jgi:hypothetical protein
LPLCQKNYRLMQMHNKVQKTNLNGSEFLFSTIWLSSSLQSCFHCLGLMVGLSWVLPDFRRLPFSACRSGLNKNKFHSQCQCCGPGTGAFTPWIRDPNPGWIFPDLGSRGYVIFVRFS